MALLDRLRREPEPPKRVSRTPDVERRRTLPASERARANNGNKSD